jgi:hypothetical protein
MSEPTTGCPHDLPDLTGAMDPDSTITVYCRGCGGKWTEDDIPMDILVKILHLFEQTGTDIPTL